MTHPDDHDDTRREAEAGDERREAHLGSENPHRVPVKEHGEPDEVELPTLDQDRGPDEEVRSRTRRQMH